MEEQTKDLQRQLKNEREENKRLNKRCIAPLAFLYLSSSSFDSTPLNMERVQVLEAEMRKGGNSKSGRGSDANTLGPLDKETAEAFAQVQ